MTVPTVDAILSFKNASHIVVRGLELTCAEAQGVHLKNCEHVTIEKSLIHDLGYFSGAGISIHGGHACAVRGCDLADALRRRIDEQRVLCLGDGEALHDQELREPRLLLLSQVLRALDSCLLRIWFS